MHRSRRENRDTRFSGTLMSAASGVSAMAEKRVVVGDGGGYTLQPFFSASAGREERHEEEQRPEQQRRADERAAPYGGSEVARVVIRPWRRASRPAAR